MHVPAESSCLSRTSTVAYRPSSSTDTPASSSAPARSASRSARASSSAFARSLSKRTLLSDSDCESPGSPLEHAAPSTQQSTRKRRRVVQSDSEESLPHEEQASAVCTGLQLPPADPSLQLDNQHIPGQADRATRRSGLVKALSLPKCSKTDQWYYSNSRKSPKQKFKSAVNRAMFD